MPSSNNEDESIKMSMTSSVNMITSQVRYDSDLQRLSDEKKGVALV